MEDKLKELYNILDKYKRLCIGFSGGVDSTFLVKAAKEAMGDRVFAIIADGIMLPRRELTEAIRLAEEIDIEYYILKVDPLLVPEFRYNDRQRCYHCKMEIFTTIRNKGMELGATHVADGKNTDDALVHRPGAKALVELSVVSPLYEAGFSKDDIRKYSRFLGLSTWNKPSNACLATRAPYGRELTPKLLETIEKAEYVFQDLDMFGVRVRTHKDIARIEAPKAFMGKILECNGEIVSQLKDLGYKYVTLDLEGFRSGSMD